MRVFFTFLTVIGITLSSFAKKTKVSESIEKIGDGKNNCLVVTIVGANKDDVAKAWKEQMKSTGGKISGKSEIFIDDASLPAISSNTIDIYTIVSDSKDDVILKVGFNLGGAYLNSKDHPAGYKAAEKLIYDFAVSQAKAAVNKMISSKNDEISKATKNIDGYNKSNSKLEKDIKDYEKRIESAKKDIEKNNADLEKENSLLDKLNKELKELEKKLSGLD